MIQANELRIGNWVYSLILEENAQITSINSSIKDLLNPIELTEEILLKCGFEIIKFKNPTCNVGIDLFHGYDYAIIKLGYKTDLIIRFNKSKFKIESFYSTEIKHLHQLQNLYFALTNEELEINL